MARPQKKGIDYFPLDVHTSSDKKFELIEAEFGLTGFGVVIKLFQRIYGEEGYYCEWDEEVALLFAKQIDVGCNVVSEIVKAAVRRGIFDEEMFQNYGILTSEGIQKRYVKAVVKRTSVEVNPAYWLISTTQNPETDTENGVSDGRNTISDTDNAQIKENNTISNNIILNNIKSEEKKKSYGAYSHVLLTDSEFILLKTEYPNYNDLINFLDEYIEMKGEYPVQSHFMAIKRWVIQAVEEREEREKKSGKRGILNNFNQPSPDFKEVENILWKQQQELMGSEVSE